MFERFSNKARSVLVFAQDEARALRHDFLGTEHLLLGVIASTDPTVVEALAGYENFTLQDVRDEVIAIVGAGDEDFEGQPPFTPRAKKVLELSLREALAMGHDHIGVPHILLGIMREGEGVGAQVLLKLGVDYERTRLWIGQSVGSRGPTEGRGRRSRRRMRGISRTGWPSATPPVMRMWERADARAGDLGTHDLLLALFDEEESMAAKVLAAVGVSRGQVEAKIAEIGLDNTSDAPRRPPVRPSSVKLAEGVEVRVTDPDLAKLVESGQLEELLGEIIRRSKPAS